MKFEYRYLSEERAAEINAMGIITPMGRKLSINYARCITNEDETIVFQRTFIAVPHPNDDHIDIDEYLLFYKGYQYVMKIYNDCFRKEDGEFKYHTKWIIKSEIEEKENCPSEEVLSILIEILCERSRHLGWNKIIEGTVEIIYMGEKICG